jgi:O-antigen/teichoic acid export membrane protein
VKERVRGSRFQTALTAFSGIFVVGLSAITGPLIGRSLGAAGKGDLAAVTVPPEMFGYLLAFGLPVATLYYADRYTTKQLIMSTWVFSVIVGGLAVAGLWFLIPGYLHGHNHEDVPWLRAYLVVMITYIPVSASVELLRHRQSLVAYNALRATFVLTVNTCAIVLLAIIGRLDLTTAIEAAIGSQVVWHLTVLIYCRAWPSRAFQRSVLLTQLGYGSRLVLGSLSEVVVARLDQLLLIGLVSSSELGIYTVAATAAGVSGPAAWGIALALFPRIRRAESEMEARRATREAVKWTVLSSVTVAVVVAAAAPEILPLLFGNQFRGALHPLWIMLPGQVALDLGNVISQKLMADNSPGDLSKAYVFAAVVTVVGLTLTVAHWGVIAAAVVTSVSEFCYFGYLWWKLRRNYRRPATMPTSAPADAPVQGGAADLIAGVAFPEPGPIGPTSRGALPGSEL